MMLYVENPIPKRIKTSLMLTCLSPLLTGMKPQSSNRTINKRNLGRENIRKETPISFVFLLVTSFNPSRTGCRVPMKDLLFGPIRDCPNPRIFRSNRV